MLRCGRTLIAMVLLLAPVPAAAQTADTSAASGAQAQTPGQPRAAAEMLKPEQLEALVAPIALYPDELLANVLAASTYPLEVVQADRWLKEHKTLRGDALKTEVEKQPWDDSIKALASTAEVLSMMSDKLDWTKVLGDAVLAQQSDVMDAVQRLRTKAYDNKKLLTTTQQKVSVKTEESRQVVVIEPAVPDTMYVPYYEPATVYGAWPYTEYPPYYFGYPSYIGAGVVAAGLAFGTAWAIGRWGNYWGGGCNWGNRNVYINHRTTNIGTGWQHNPSHRQGVRYNNANVQQRFGNSNLKAGAADRMDFRGRDGQQVLKPGQDRPGGADRAGDRAADRAGDRGGDRQGAGDRAKAGGDRAKGGGDRAAKGGGAKNAGAKSAGPKAGGAKGGGAKAANRGGSGSVLNVSSGRSAAAASARGHASMASMGPRGGGGGGASFAGRGGGGGFQGGGGRGGGGGGGRRSDIALKHDVVLLGHLASGLGYYRFSYIGSDKAYVGVIAQEVEDVKPVAVTRGADGYLRVYYEKLGLKFRTYRDWLESGARIPGEVTP
ncbi:MULTISPECIES: DUF3300 domain-containing protein [unclassified Bradyrhizobium]|jgi:Protein of unknown function (DUF3300)|uniref:DUF3300 domain-containing protein n=1 Tax=unclassified Bradyrhizobium TaxID=2631580 RepID=UPI001FF81687|nr:MULTISPECIES: DUF3300 domain-containing protein [unclassified Bradyrhizobium]MCK1305105.1 DUF3300 domain-containing protein [Bradyrhizobium sp. 45]MCK1314817.1 DUF3300 domain-containing protein [Bradyrhizobium sp. 23]MCK1326944.1 DUF3300 domain-containing protein [Bradyrhizobium sp. CW9]MCK1467136.1 DUF3300 domain-containing protein [Bradyrhizobium sp. CW10]MCK1486250.1 DUF3300 domain-containing protein [Bradyrhizobium sp. 193]